MKFKIILTFLFVILIFAFLIFNFVKAATNIDSTYRYAWNDTIGWIDFGYSIGNVNVYGDRLEGYASSSVGYIALDCATSPSPPADCAINFPGWKVSNDDNGYLSGWAYNDAIGWISFTCNHTNDGTSPPYNTNECITTNYGVTINSSSGDFSGWAWNDVAGWISFNCNQSETGNTCGVSDYKVKTNWNTVPISGNLTSSIFDSQASGGAAINSIMWQGALNNGEVKFQIASAATPTGPWEYKGPGGTNSDTDTYNPGGPDLSAKINLMYHNNQRYFRYKIFLYSDSGKTQSPLVEDVLVNWSP